jgi:acyl carrier protein
MKNDKILSQLNNVFIEVLNNNTIVLNENTTATDIEEWDSINNILLILAIERHFKIRFTSKEMRNWKNVGEMLSTIKQKGI